ncbi:MAG: PaaI family thioesterase [Minwuia sp.]|uniref:PaaI family thioesterase n=1 Tax=Minwuia sp. TaxID=2493630 RepID=UPI003A880285
MTGFQPRDPGYAEKVRESLHRQGFAKLLGYDTGRIEPGFVEIVCPMDPKLAQQHGFAHGGVIATLADAAAAYAAFSLMPEDSAPLTVEMKINLMAPGKGETLIARGTVLKPGRTLTVCEAKVAAVTGGEETLIATALVTMICLDGRPDTA